MTQDGYDWPTPHPVPPRLPMTFVCDLLPDDRWTVLLGGVIVVANPERPPFFVLPGQAGC